MIVIPHKVCLVDDEAIIRKSLELILQSNHYQVSSVKNGALALNELTSFAPDVYIVDVELPDINGQLLAEQLRTLKPNIGIILFTGLPSVEIEKTSLINSYFLLYKPINIDLLLATLSEIFEPK